MINQNTFTEKALFDYYMVSNSEERTIHSQIPFYLDSVTYNKIVRCSETINRVSLRVLEEIDSKHKRLIDYVDEFPCKERIFNIKCKVSPLLWTRFDTFIDTKGSVKFAEFNYDKPCAQKEIGLAGSASFDGNINKGFEKELINKIKKISEVYKDKNITIAVLIDPCHYEELHIAYYLKKLCDNDNIRILQVGPKNFSVIDNSVYAFECEKIDIIIRLFPVEYLHEVDNIDEIFRCFEKGKVLIVNDPRVIAIQAKIFFAYLWELIENNSSLITKEEAETIKASIPYTTIFTKENYNEVLMNKDNYVLKSSLGRYSEQVYIGKLYDKNKWNLKVNEVLKEENIHIIQEVIDIKKEYVYYPDEHNMNIPSIAYGNFGVFLIDEELEGICVRWSNSFLTDNSETRMSPIGIKDYDFILEEYKKYDRKDVWDKVVERAMLEYQFTGQYINTNEFISLNSLIVSQRLFEKIEEVSIEYVKILDKTSKFIKDNLEVFSSLLGIPDSVKEVVLQSATEAFCAIGRLDLAIDNNGIIKILEFNSETPAGIVESLGIQEIIKEELIIPYCNPNKELKNHILESFKSIIRDFQTKIKIRNIAFLCTSYHEDWYNTGILSDICKEIGDYNIILGNIYDLEVRNDQLYLYDTPLDAVYRYFPLDWFAYEKELSDVLSVLNKKTYSINPTHTLITQSKSLYAIIFELIGKGFYTKEEESFISKHLPYTCLEPNEKLSVDCLAKPYLSREGKGIILSYEGIEKDIKDVIFQERVNIAPIRMTKYRTEYSCEKFQFPVIGVYIAGIKPCGLFTRVGDFITNESACFVTTFLNN